MNILKKALGQVQQPKCNTAKELLTPCNAIKPLIPPSEQLRQQLGMQPTIESIKQWINDRNLQTADPRVQMCKVVEELGELASAINKGNIEGQKDGIGDTIVTLIVIAEILGHDFYECMAIAYNEIKDRKGKMINGVFVKVSDLK